MGHKHGAKLRIDPTQRNRSPSSLHARSRSYVDDASRSVILFATSAPISISRMPSHIHISGLAALVLALSFAAAASAQSRQRCTDEAESVWTPNPGGQGGYYRTVRRRVCTDIPDNTPTQRERGSGRTQRPKYTPEKSAPPKELPPMAPRIGGSDYEMSFRTKQYHAFGSRPMAFLTTDSIRLALGRDITDTLSDGTRLVWEDREFIAQPAPEKYCSTDECAHEYTSTRSLHAVSCKSSDSSAGTISEPYITLYFFGQVQSLRQNQGVSTTPYLIDVKRSDTTSINARVVQAVCNAEQFAALPKLVVVGQGSSVFTPPMFDTTTVLPTQLPVARLPIVAQQTISEERRIALASKDTLLDGSWLVWEQVIRVGKPPKHSTSCLDGEKDCGKRYDSELLLTRHLCRTIAGALGYFDVSPRLSGRYDGQRRVLMSPNVYTQFSIPLLAPPSDVTTKLYASRHHAVCTQIATGTVPVLQGDEVKVTRY